MLIGVITEGEREGGGGGIGWGERATGRVSCACVFDRPD